MHDEIEQDEGPMDQSEEEGEDLIESAERDYEPMDVPLRLRRNWIAMSPKAQIATTFSSTLRRAARQRRLWISEIRCSAK